MIARAALALALAAGLPTLAFAGQITLYNWTGGPVEIRAVRAGKVTVEDRQIGRFLYQAEDGDFRVWLAGDKCDHVFLYETADDVELLVQPGPVLYRLPPNPGEALQLDAIAAAQPAGWPMKPASKICD